MIEKTGNKRELEGVVVSNSMELEVGSKVRIRESKPYSKNVRWIVINKE